MVHERNQQRVAPRREAGKRSRALWGLAAGVPLIVAFPNLALQETSPAAAATAPVAAIVRPPTQAPVTVPSPGSSSAVRDDLVDRRLLDTQAAGRLAYAEGNLEQALEHFRDAIDANPDSAEAFSNAAQLLVRLERPADAVPLLERAVGLAPGEWRYRFNLARAAGEAGNWARAVTHYQEAADLRPDHFPTRFNLARAYHKSGQEERAIAEYERAQALDSDDGTLKLALGVSHEAAGNLSAAADAYTEYLRQVPAGGDADAVRQRIERLRAAASAPAPAAS